MSLLQVYALSTLEALDALPTPPNPRGVVALSQAPGRPLLALPCASGPGVVAVHEAGGHADGASAGSGALCELCAHRDALVALAFSPDATQLASASEHGCVVRVHDLGSGLQVAALRRGLTPALVVSLSFAHHAPLLVASSDSGTVHVFRLEEDGEAAHGEAAHAHTGSPPRRDAPASPHHNQYHPSVPSRVGAAARSAALAAAHLAAGAVLCSLVPRLPRALRAPVADSLQACRAAVTVRVGTSSSQHAAASSPHAPQHHAAPRSTCALLPGPDGSHRLLVTSYDGLFAEHEIVGLHAGAPSPHAGSSTGGSGPFGGAFAGAGACGGVAASGGSAPIATLQREASLRPATADDAHAGDGRWLLAESVLPDGGHAAQQQPAAAGAHAAGVSSSHTDLSASVSVGLASPMPGYA